MFRNRRLTPIILAMLTLLSGTLSAQFAGGTGTQADPYQIATAQHLDNMRNYMNNRYFRLTADIDLGIAPYNTGAGWEPIGSIFTNEFTGTIDGGDHSISNLFINRPGFDIDEQGLLGRADATILNLNLDNVNITTDHSETGAIAGLLLDGSISNCSVSGTIIGRDACGGLVGRCSNGQILDSSFLGTVRGTGPAGGIAGLTDQSQITRCSVQGSVLEHPTFMSQNLGGITGRATDSQIRFCDATVTITGYYFEGGIVGQCEDSSLASCFASGSISGLSKLGGLAGKVTSSQISDCFAHTNTGNASAEELGGLVGSIQDSNLSNCYSTGLITWENTEPSFAGGLVGKSTGSTATHSYWNYETSGMQNSALGEMRNTDQMTYPYDPETYVGWNFYLVWQEDTQAQNQGYPLLRPGQESMFAGGSGSSADPYQIATAQQLYNVRWFLDACFIQTANIDLSEAPFNAGWLPIGMLPDQEPTAAMPFTGEFNGNDYSINNLTINLPGNQNTGLFWKLDRADIINLAVLNANVSGGSRVGVLAGSANLIYSYNCTAEGSVTGVNEVGGVMGRAQSSTIARAVSLVGVVASELAGGLIGECSASNVTDSYSRAPVQALNIAGGFIGSCLLESSISTCYSTGLVTANTNAGGFMGQNSADSTVNFCYWDMQSSGLENSAAGEGRTHEAMTIVPYPGDTYVSFDYDHVWMPDPNAEVNDGYPYLEFRPVNNDDPAVPVADVILRVHPNPFNTLTSISFDFPKPARASLQIYNLKGQLVQTIIKSELLSGKSSFEWDGRNSDGNPLASGIYFCVLRTEGRSLTRKMTLLR